MSLGAGASSCRAAPAAGRGVRGRDIGRDIGACLRWYQGLVSRVGHRPGHRVGTPNRGRRDGRAQAAPRRTRPHDDRAADQVAQPQDARSVP